MKYLIEQFQYMNYILVYYSVLIHIDKLKKEIQKTLWDTINKAIVYDYCKAYFNTHQ